MATSCFLVQSGGVGELNPHTSCLMPATNPSGPSVLCDYIFKRAWLVDHSGQRRGFGMQGVVG